MEFLVASADGPEHLDMLARLLRRYIAEQGWHNEHHHIQEIDSLPGEYAPPAGRALLALDSAGQPLGCVVLRPIAEWCPDCVEMRRLYVVPEARRRGVARALTASSESWALDAGYERLRLVTLPYMVEAIRLYESLSFQIVNPYRPSTAEDAIFMDKPLR